MKENDPIIEGLRNRSVLTAEERKSAQEHVEKRDFGSSGGTPPLSKNQDSSESRQSIYSWSLKAGIAIVVVLAMLIGMVVVLFINDANVRADKLATAQRELQGYADQLNKSLPAENQVVINSVAYRQGSFEVMIVKLTQGNTVCTAPVNPPDDKHNLYWASAVAEVPLDQISSAEFKCIQTSSYLGLGAS